MGKGRDILLQLRYARGGIEYAEGMLKGGSPWSSGELRAHINSAISALKAVNLLIREEGREKR